MSPRLDFRIVDETPGYLVVDKPPFLLAHPTKLKPGARPRSTLPDTPNPS